MSTPTRETRPQSQIFYVREADPAILPPELKDHPGPFYALHSEDGTPIALAPNRRDAVALALKNDLILQSVH